MGSCTYNCLMNVINLGNSIIGVSILAMPYCFRRCGILLSLLLIIISGLLVKTACYLLLKGAIKARRRNFEFLAFHTLGSSGKLAVEIGIIGFLIGVCIAFFVVIGDIGPPLASEYLTVENTSNLRAYVLMFLGLFVALPLGLLRKVDSLTSLSALSIAFYGCLVVKIFSEAVPKLIENEWKYKVNWWQTDGILSCLPIFSMALSCQTQLFEFFDTLNEPSLNRMMPVVRGAVHLCSAVYILVGVFGYIAFCDKSITGNILVLLTPSVMTEFIKIGFVLTLVISFPLCLFPCRSSLHSLLFKQGLGHHDIAANFIPDHRFRLLTITLVTVTIGIAIMLPNIEFVLGIIGSTIGTTICLIFPAVIFIYDTNKNTTERRFAQAVMFVGVFILVACTYSTLNEEREPKPSLNLPQGSLANFQNLVVTKQQENLIASVSPALQIQGSPEKPADFVNKKEEEKKAFINKDTDEKRQEPPIPHEPEMKVEKGDQHADLDPQALQKEDKELLKDVPKPVTAANVAEASFNEKHEQLLRKLEQQQEEQKLILEQQKKVLEELKHHQESHDEKERKNAEIPQNEAMNAPKKSETKIIIKQDNVKGSDPLMHKDSQILSNVVPTVPVDFQHKPKFSPKEFKRTEMVDVKLNKNMIKQRRNSSSLLYQSASLPKDNINKNLKVDLSQTFSSQKLITDNGLIKEHLKTVNKTSLFNEKPEILIKKEQTFLQSNQKPDIKPALNHALKAQKNPEVIAEQELPLKLQNSIVVNKEMEDNAKLSKQQILEHSGPAYSNVSLKKNETVLQKINGNKDPVIENEKNEIRK